MENFTTLLSRLATQHQIEIDYAVRDLKAENDRLAAEVEHLKASGNASLENIEDVLPNVVHDLTEDRDSNFFSPIPNSPSPPATTPLVLATTMPGKIPDGPSAADDCQEPEAKEQLCVQVSSKTAKDSRAPPIWLEAALAHVIASSKPPDGPLQFVHGQVFLYVIGFLILLNSIWNLVQTELMIKAFWNGEKPNGSFVYVDVSFALLFTLEKSLVLRAGSTFFFRGPDRWWNMFDLAVVALSWFECATELLGKSNEVDLSFMRSFRLIRVVRILRSAENLPGMHSMQALLQALTSCVDIFCAALMLLMFVLGIFALSFMQATVGHLAKFEPHERLTDEDSVILYDHFGTFFSSGWTLIAMITGGIDWLGVSLAIRNTWLYACFFFGYIACVSIGMMSLLTGIFVHCATHAMQINREIAVHMKRQEQQQVATELMKLFLECDRDLSLSITLDELLSKLHDERILAYFLHLDLDAGSVGEIFNLLDEDGSGDISMTEFVDGCVQYRGSAKAVHVGTLMGEIMKLRHKIEEVILAVRQPPPIRELT